MEILHTKLERIEELKLSKKAFKEIFEFFEKIFIEKEAVKGKIESFENYPDQAGIQLRMKEGFPIADSGSFKPDTGALEKYFLTLLNIMAEKNSDEVKYIKDAIAGIDGGFKAFLRS